MLGHQIKKLKELSGSTACGMKNQGRYFYVVESIGAPDLCWVHHEVNDIEPCTMVVAHVSIFTTRPGSFHTPMLIQALPPVHGLQADTAYQGGSKQPYRMRRPHQSLCFD
ncbi:unnamed protein product [Arctogadus glacialis]